MKFYSGLVILGKSNQWLKLLKIQKKEWIFVLLVTLGILLLTSIPYIYGYVSAPDEKVFMGFTYNVDDHTQYYSWYTAFQSEFLISNRQTSESNPKIFFNLLWWILAQFWQNHRIELLQPFTRFFAGFPGLYFCLWFIFSYPWFLEKWKNGVWHF